MAVLEILMMVFGLSLVVLTIISQFQFYRKWVGGFWVKNKEYRFSPWFLSDERAVEMIEEYPEILDEISHKYKFEDWRKNENSNSRKSPDLKIVN